MSSRVIENCIIKHSGIIQNTSEQSTKPLTSCTKILPETLAKAFDKDKRYLVRDFVSDEEWSNPDSLHEVPPDKVIGEAFNLRQNENGNLVCDILINKEDFDFLDNQDFYASGYNYNIEEDEIDGLKLYIEHEYKLNYVYLDQPEGRRPPYLSK